MAPNRHAILLFNILYFLSQYHTYFAAYYEKIARLFSIYKNDAVVVIL